MEKINGTSMSKVTACGLAIAMFSAFMLTACSMGLHSEKHTGPVTFVGAAYGQGWQLERPNGEIIVMNVTSDTRPNFYEGQKFLDVIYVDMGERHWRDFVSAMKDPNSPPPTKPEINYERQYSGVATICCRNGQTCHWDFTGSGESPKKTKR